MGTLADSMTGNSGPSLTEEEAKKFLELYRMVSSDMNEAMEDAFAGDESSEYEERYDGSSGSLYTDCTRNKFERFVNEIYLDGSTE